MIKIVSPIDARPLLKSYFRLEHLMKWTEYLPKGRQTCLQYCEGEDPWTSGTGTSLGDQSKYSLLNPFFSGTVFEDIIQTYKLKRTRLMWVGPMSCYSFHVDQTPRIHIPLITNLGCYFVFKNGTIEHLPSGNVYWVDTRNEHTFINTSVHFRLHIVGVVEE